MTQLVDVHSSIFQFTEVSIAKNRNTYAKRQREQDKKYRAERKRERREQNRSSDRAELISEDVPAPEQGTESTPDNNR